MATDQPSSQIQPRPLWASNLGMWSILWGVLSLPCCAPILCIHNRLTNPSLDFHCLPSWYLVCVVVSEGLSFAAAVLLIVAGAFLRRARLSARRLHVAYAYLVLALTLCNSLLVWLGLGFAPIPPDIRAGLNVGAGLAILWATPYPIFLLIWFSRATIRQQVRTWSTSKHEGNKATPPMEPPST